MTETPCRVELPCCRTDEASAIGGMAERRRMPMPRQTALVVERLKKQDIGFTTA